MRAGQPAGGVDALRKVVERGTTVLGAEHPEVAGAMHELASVLTLQGDPRGAEPFAREALRIRQMVLGPGHLQTVDTLVVLALVLGNLGRHHEAEPLLRGVLELAPEVLDRAGRRFTDVQAALADDLLVQGRFGEAEELFREAIARLEAGRPSPIPAMAQVLTGFLAALSLAVLGQNRASEAADLLERAIAAAAVAHGQDSSQVGDLERQLALVQEQAGDPASATTAREALSTLRRALGEGHLTTKAAERELGRLAGDPPRGQ